MQIPPPSPTSHHDIQHAGSGSGRSTSRRTARQLVRFSLYALSYLGGSATGTSAVALVLYQPADWRWVFLGVGGLLAGACAAGLAPYFPKYGEDRP